MTSELDRIYFKGGDNNFKRNPLDNIVKNTKKVLFTSLLGTSIFFGIDGYEFVKKDVYLILNESSKTRIKSGETDGKTFFGKTEIYEKNGEMIYEITLNKREILDKELNLDVKKGMLKYFISVDEKAGVYFAQFLFDRGYNIGEIKEVLIYPEYYSKIKTLNSIYKNIKNIYEGNEYNDNEQKMRELKDLLTIFYHKIEILIPRKLNSISKRYIKAEENINRNLSYLIEGKKTKLGSSLGFVKFSIKKGIIKNLDNYSFDRKERILKESIKGIDIFIKKVNEDYNYDLAEKFGRGVGNSVKSVELSS